MTCQQCKSQRVASVSSFGRDCQNFDLLSSRKDAHTGYLPNDIGLGGGDYLKFRYCLDCGQIQGKFPLPPTEFEAVDETE